MRLRREAVALQPLALSSFRIQQASRMSTMSTAKKLSSRTQRRIRLNLAKQHSLALWCDDLNQSSAKRARTSTQDQETVLQEDAPLSSLDLPLPSDSDSDDSPDRTSTSSDLSLALGADSTDSQDLMDLWSDSSSTLGSDSLSELGNDSLSEFDTQSNHLVDTSSDDDAGINQPVPVKQSSTPLYVGSAITAHQFDVAVASIAQRHNLTYACQTDILRFMSAVLPAPNSGSTSARSLTRKFVRYGEQARLHRCCGVCMRRLPEGEKCAQADCLSQGEPDATFAEVPLDKQLQERFKGEYF